MSLSIDKKACTGHGLCYAAAPALITADERGRGEVLVDVVPPQHQAEAEAARAGCPEQAVLLD